jgi:hypothetical protein
MDNLYRIGDKPNLIHRFIVESFKDKQNHCGGFLTKNGLKSIVPNPDVII